MRYILVAGSPVDSFNSSYSYQDGDKFIGIDLGCEKIIDNGYSLDLAIGDFDTTKRVNEIKQKAKRFVEYSPIKDEIDLELALKFLLGTKEQILVYDALGARTDHELMTFKLLLKYKSLNITIVSDIENVSYIYNTEITLTKHNNRFSLIPLENVTLTIKGAKYELENAHLTIDDNFTSSNKTLACDTTIKCKNGGLILIVGR